MTLILLVLLPLCSSVLQTLVSQLSPCYSLCSIYNLLTCVPRQSEGSHSRKEPSTCSFYSRTCRGSSSRSSKVCHRVSWLYAVHIPFLPAITNLAHSAAFNNPVSARVFATQHPECQIMVKSLSVQYPKLGLTSTQTRYYAFVQKAREN